MNSFETINHEAAVQRGATFDVELSIVGAPENVSSSLKNGHLAETIFPETGLLSGKPAQILVLDDESSIGELLGEMVEIIGHRPVICHDPIQALELLEEGDFELILSDFRMPGMNGQQFYKQLLLRKPALARRVIFLTGDVVNEETQAFLEAVGNPHLSKPFQLFHIEEAIGAILNMDKPLAA